MAILFFTVMPSPYQRQLFAAMAAAGMDVAVRYYTGGAHDREWELPELHPFEKVMAGRTLAQLGPSAHWNPDVMAEIEEVLPDLVVVSDYSAPTAQVVMRRLARQGRPFVFWGEVPGFSKRGLLGSLVRRQLQAPLAKAAGIAAIGSGAARAYRDLFPGKPVSNIPYFCDLAPYREARARTTAARESIDILFSGQMIERKGVDVLISAFGEVASRHPRLRLKLLGGGPEQARFAAMVPEALRERVHFLGHREPADLPEVFAQADIFCLPSRHDGWGVVVNEALGTGLPLIVSDAVGAGHDLVAQGRNGFVVRTGDVQDLARALEQLADDGRRAEMSRTSERMAQDWELAEGVRRWRAATAEIVGGEAAA
ncbi:glycosyltransferase family 4 protein [Roseitranquillus sediminis]|uniref:glycosyltransferase family 4 protein n=1 Tax=Roseitranquillus sediminis TaxID=2809051 RepID=UPI001D0C8086|nr:glycosyltransferase [Roseitranquillus sediminis]MBM9594018.1 glycosyltransferase [Roseitranquillus sediminis]